MGFFVGVMFLSCPYIWSIWFYFTHVPIPEIRPGIWSGTIVVSRITTPRDSGNSMLRFQPRDLASWAHAENLWQYFSFSCHSISSNPLDIYTLSATFRGESNLIRQFEFVYQKHVLRRIPVLSTFFAQKSKHKQFIWWEKKCLKNTPKSSSELPFHLGLFTPIPPWVPLQLQAQVSEFHVVPRV